MSDYVFITVVSESSESEADFSARLSRFWTHMLRTRKPDFEKVYAEATAFEEQEGRLARQYLAEAEVVDVLELELRAAELDHEPIDRNEVYSKYEAVAPEWMQIEH